MVYELRPSGVYGALTYYKNNPGGVSYVKVLWVQEQVDIIGKTHITIAKVDVTAGAIQTE